MTAVSRCFLLFRTIVQQNGVEQVIAVTKLLCPDRIIFKKSAIISTCATYFVGHDTAVYT